MDDENSDVFANRGTPIPVVAVTSPGGHSPPVSGIRTPSDRDGSKHRRSLSPSKLKDKLESLGDHINSPESPSRMSDRMFGMLLQQVFPKDDYDDDDHPKDRRSRKYVDRPSFSLPTMSSNFRRFNARIGVAFVFQNRLIRLFTWRQPTQTLSFLATYTFICLNPPLLAVLPLAGCLFFIMVPAFLARHPPPPTHNPTDLYPLAGPSIAPAQTIRPAPELSKDFFRNMRDLQNSMEDFSRLHDSVITYLTPPTNFSNEALSSVLYLILISTACLLFITAHLIPWRAVFLIAGWVAVCAAHPFFQSLISETKTDEMLKDQEQKSRSFLLRLSRTDIELTTSPEVKEVEIFELQYRPLHDQYGAYEPYLFSSSSYAPLSPSRVAGDRPKGTPFFEDVQPPRGWRWSDKKWTLDLLSREWAEERCVTGVEVEIEGERWVTDLIYEGAGDEEFAKSRKKKGHSKNGSNSWEESHRPSRRGEWRRRRWVRGVERIPMRSSE